MSATTRLPAFLDPASDEFLDVSEMTFGERMAAAEREALDRATQADRDNDEARCDGEL